MLNKARQTGASLYLALAPIFLTLWFVEISTAFGKRSMCLGNDNLAAHWQAGSAYLLAALMLSSLCFGLVWLSASRHGLERLPVKIKVSKNGGQGDRRLFAGLPVAANQPEPEHHQPASVLVFVAVIFFFIVYNSHAYHFNPLLGFFGYHFFEVTIEGDITYVLITRQNITDCKNVSQVVQLTEYMILDANHAK
jgi:hypothetical protein